jgi:hypothetical protein
MRRSFTLKKKAEIIVEQEKQGLSNHTICACHSIQLNQLKKWKESADLARFQSKRKRSLSLGRRSIYHIHEDQIKAFILQQHENRSVVNI